MQFRRIVVSLSIAWLAVVSNAWSEGVSIGGRVLDGAGTPLAEAQVTLLPLQEPREQARSILEGRTTEAVAAVLSDSGGHFRLSAPRAGLWTVRVEAPGYVPLETSLQPLIEPVELEDAKMSIDGGLTVSVTDGRGAALGGALVLLHSDRSRFAFGGASWRLALRAGVTADDGTVRLPRGERERWALGVSAGGHAFSERRGLHGSAAKIRLEAGRARTFVVLSSDEQPVAGVLATVGQQPHPLGVTDERGRITLQADAAGSLEMDLLADDLRQAKTTLEAPAAEESGPRTVQLPDRLAISGRLIDATSRRAIAEGLVWDRSNPIEGVVTDAGGGFVLSGPQGRILEITAGAPGFLNSDGFEFQLADDGRPGPTLALHPAAAVEGLVLDHDGEPVAGAELEVDVRHNPGMMRIEIGGPSSKPRTLSDARGAFRISPLNPEARYRIRTRAEGFAPADLDVPELEPYRTRTGLRVGLSRGQTLRGTVVDEDGGPIGEASIAVRPAPGGPAGGMFRMMDNSRGSESFEATSDDEGRFEVAGLPEGKLDLEARRSGFAKRKVPAIEIAEGETNLDLGEVVLESGERVHGIVTDRDGVPVEGVEVHLSEGGAPMMFAIGGPPGGEKARPDAVSDPSGWFAVDDLGRSGRYDFGFSRTGFVARNVSGVTVPQIEPIEVRLEPASKVIGHVLGPEGDPVPGAQVNMSRTRTMEMGGNVMQMMMMTGEQCDAEGRFVFEDQEPGRISLSAVASGYQEAKLDNLEIPKGEDLDGVEIPLDAGAILQGRVLAPDGRAALGAEVRKISEGEGMIRMGGAAADGSGYYRLEGLEPGPVSIEAQHADYPRTVKDVELREGLNSLDLAFEGGQEVSGYVTDTSGTPVGDAAVHLAVAGRMWGGPETTTSADGTFRLAGVQDGDYRLWVESGGYAPSTGEQSVLVAGEPVSGLHVQLEVGASLIGQVSGIAPELFGKVSVRANGPTPTFGGTAVDFQGNYRLENLLPGDYDVVASLEESGRRADGRVTIEAGAQETHLDLRFGGGITLSGTAVQGESPVAGATVFAAGVDIRHDGWCQTDHQGGFSIEGLEPGSYRVRLQNMSTGLVYEETVELSTSREITLEIPTARVAGRITDNADRRALAGVTLTLDSTESTGHGLTPSHTASTDLNGSFELSSIADGNWTLSASKEGYAAVSRAIAVQQGRGLDDLQLTMDPTEGLRLETRLPTGGSPSEVRLAVLDPGGISIVHGIYSTGENGSVRLSSVPPGSWDVVLTAGGSATSEVRVQAPGPTVPVSLLPACTLSVTVPELQGSNVLGSARIRRADGRPFRALNWDARPIDQWPMSGRLEFASLPPGAWTVSVGTADGRTWEGQATTTPGAPSELVLE